MPSTEQVGGPITQNPYGYDFIDNSGTNKVTIRVAFNAVSRAITGITVTRDAACLYTKIYIGTGAGGDPDSTNKKITVPIGTTVLNPTQLAALAANGVGTIEEFLGFQITAGP